MIRTIVLGACVLALAACQQAQPVVYNPYPPPQHYRAPIKKPVSRPGDRRDKIEQTDIKTDDTKPADNFSQMEDRFISTHPPDVSAKELGRSKESVDDRAKQLNQQ